MSNKQILFFVFSLLINGESRAFESGSDPKSTPRHSKPPTEEALNQFFEDFGALGFGATPPSPVKTPDVTYEKKQKVSKKFLDNYEIVKPTVEPLFERFKADYEKQQTTTLDVTPLSDRARIQLMKKITEYKQEKLPVSLEESSTYRKGFDKNYDTLQKKPTAFWKTFVTKPPFYEIVDRVPVFLKMEDRELKFEVRMTPRQPGSGKLYGIDKEDVSETYKQLKSPVAKAYKTHDQQTQKRFELLLDYEVARRLSKGDAHADLPILTSNALLLDHMDDPKLLNQYLDGVLGGSAREEGIKEIIETHHPEGVTKKQLRDTLRSFHHEDEDSGEDYATTDEDESPGT